MEAGKLEPGWTGKTNAVWTAARRARGRWLLFTDADTHPRAGRPAPRDARGGAAQGGHVELLAAADCQRIRAAVADAAGLLRAGAGLSAGQGLRSGAAHRRGQRAVSAGRARGLPQAGRSRQRSRQGAGRRGTGGSGQAAQGGAALSLCGRCRLRAHVSQHRGDDRGLDQEPEAAVRQRADAGGLAGDGFFSSFWTADFGLSNFGTRGWARTGWSGSARDGFWRCCGCARSSGFIRAWQSRTFPFWIARFRRWVCRCLWCCSIAAGFSTGF